MSPPPATPQLRYTKLERIGHGSFGEVFRGLDNSTGEAVAIKTVDLEDDGEGIDEIRREIGVLSTCDSPNIIRYRGSYLVDTKLWIIMDYCAMGSLRQLIVPPRSSTNAPLTFQDTMGPLDEASVLTIAHKVLLALSYLHANHIIHRDIKAANILLTEDGQVRLGDFGVASQVLSNFRRNSFVGSPYWMAPEVIKRAQYDSKADIWSFGITMFELLMGSPPLAKVEPSRAIFIISKNAPPRLDSQYSQLLQDLVNSCLHDDPQKRPSADDLLSSKAIRSIKRATSNPLWSLVDQYRRKRRSSAEHQDRPSTTLAAGTDDERGGTAKSNWTFGTYRSEEYDDHTRRIDSSLDAVSEASGSSAHKPIDPLADPMQLLHLRSSSLADSASSTGKQQHQLQQQQPDSPPPQSRSVSTVSQALISENEALRSKMASSSIANHRKQPSLLSLSLDDGDSGAMNFLDELQALETSNHRKQMQLCDWPHEITESNRLDAAKVYRMFILLKHSLLEIPGPSDPRASVADLTRKLAEHQRYAEKYLSLITSALNMLQQASQ